MARTYVPAWDDPIYMTTEQIRDLIRQTLVEFQGDCDKAGDVDDANYYEGGVTVCNDLLFTMTFPRRPEDARTCQHDNQVWLGHECGLCAAEGYKWKDAS
jgi:hypothetical protein